MSNFKDSVQALALLLALAVILIVGNTIRLVSFLLMLLSGPVSNLSTLYQSSFALSGFSLFAPEMLFIAGMGLGVIGAWIAVGRQLRRIEP